MGHLNLLFLVLLSFYNFFSVPFSYTLIRTKILTEKITQRGEENIAHHVIFFALNLVFFYGMKIESHFKNQRNHFLGDLVGNYREKEE